MTYEEFNAIVHVAYQETGWFIDMDSLPSNVTEVEVGEWSDEGKYSSRSDIYKAGENYFRIDSSRSGSYYTDYYYDDPDVSQVVPVKKIVEITEWKGV